MKQCSNEQFATDARSVRRRRRGFVLGLQEFRFKPLDRLLLLTLAAEGTERGKDVIDGEEADRADTEEEHVEDVLLELDVQDCDPRRRQEVGDHEAEKEQDEKRDEKRDPFHAPAATSATTRPRSVFPTTDSTSIRTTSPIRGAGAAPAGPGSASITTSCVARDLPKSPPSFAADSIRTSTVRPTCRSKESCVCRVWSSTSRPCRSSAASRDGTGSFRRVAAVFCRGL